MTPKQIQIYSMLLEAKSYKEIARKLYISKETVKTHCRCIYRLYGVKNRSELIAYVLNTKIMQNQGATDVRRNILNNHPK
ncbi:MAG: helix-turn-helix transcriptional regulator [Candidatus Thiodiazotropha sp.]